MVVNWFALVVCAMVGLATGLTIQGNILKGLIFNFSKLYHILWPQMKFVYKIFEFRTVFFSEIRFLCLHICLAIFTKIILFARIYTQFLINFTVNIFQILHISLNFGHKYKVRFWNNDTFLSQINLSILSYILLYRWELYLTAIIASLVCHMISK